MNETELKVEEFYQIVDVGEGSIAYHPNKDDYIDKIVKLIYFFGKWKSGYVGCNIVFQQAFTLIDKKTGKKIHRKEGWWASFHEIELEEVQILVIQAPNSSTL